MDTMDLFWIVKPVDIAPRPILPEHLVPILEAASFPFRSTEEIKSIFAQHALLKKGRLAEAHLRREIAAAKGDKALLAKYRNEIIHQMVVLGTFDFMRSQHDFFSFLRKLHHVPSVNPPGSLKKKVEEKRSLPKRRRKGRG
ncbi:MAG: hypothetical protein AABX02_05260 [archaeon]